MPEATPQSMPEPTYEHTTERVHIRVRPQYDPARSDADAGRHVWLYTVDITNTGSAPVRLLARHWIITDAAGHTEEVQGPGVVGETPLIKPGETFTYTSGCPLATTSGMMRGTYQMVRADGASFDAVVPAFSLDAPGADRVLN